MSCVAGRSYPVLFCSMSRRIREIFSDSVSKVGFEVANVSRTRIRSFTGGIWTAKPSAGSDSSMFSEPRTESTTLWFF